MITQSKFLEKLRPGLEQTPGVKAAFVFGSYARGEATQQSDLDVALWVETRFDPQAAAKTWRSALGVFAVPVETKSKIALFAPELRIEIAYSHRLEDFARDYIGSEIPSPEGTVVFDRTSEVLPFLRSLNPEIRMDGKDKDVIDAVQKFVYNFECASSYHRRSDAYRFYYTYNIALNEAVRLDYWAHGWKKFSYLPKRINVLYSLDELQRFYELNGTLFLRETNTKKRKLLDYFYHAIENLQAVDPVYATEIKEFCESVYRRDYFWNLRDVAQNNDGIRPGVVFRSSSMTPFQNEALFEELIQNVTTFIDLRADDEIEKEPYSDPILRRIRWVNCPLDPSKQSEHFRNHEQYGTNSEIAYRFFAVECGRQIATAMRTIIDAEKAVLIHCAAGKDRTGCVVSLLHLLSGASKEIVYADYAASEMDVELSTLNQFLNVVEACGGVRDYLLYAGMNTDEIELLKTKICKN